MAWTLTGAIALLGPEARASDGPVDIVIEGGRIAAIRPAGSAEPVGTVIDARKRLVAAGLVNGHHHSHEHYHKGRYDRVPLELWMNNVRPLDPIPVTARQVYLRTLVGAIEALRSGATTIVDDLNVSPVLHRDHVEAAFQAYRDAGIRALVGITLFDKPFFRAMPFVEEEFEPELLAELDGKPRTPVAEVKAFARELARDFHPARSRVGYIVAPSAPQRCTDEFLLEMRAFADEFDLPLMTHVQETRLQAVSGPLFYGCTMLEHLDRLGILKPKTTVIHAVWVTPREIERLAASGATVQHNPNSNLKLGSGLAPLRALLDGGVNVSLGTDGCGSIETVHMLKTVSSTALVHKLRGDDYQRWIGAEEAWRAGTMGGATALGFGDSLGAVEEGRTADLTVWRLDRIPFTPLNDPLRQLVYNETGAGLDTVFVDGEPVMREGRLTRIDEDALLAEIAEEHAVIAPLIARSEVQVGRLSAAYARIWERCRALELDGATYPAKLPF